VYVLIFLLRVLLAQTGARINDFET